MLSCVCSGIDHKRCQNNGKNIGDTLILFLPHLMPSVIYMYICTLYYQTNTQIHGMYLLIRV